MIIPHLKGFLLLLNLLPLNQRSNIRGITPIYSINRLKARRVRTKSLSTPPTYQSIRTRNLKRSKSIQLKLV
jgi:hypothetical protein